MVILRGIAVALTAGLLAACHSAPEVAGPPADPGSPQPAASPLAGPAGDATMETSTRPYRPRADDPLVAPHPIEDPSGALIPFFEALRRVEDAKQVPEAGRPKVLARVTHMGDSGINLDQLPHFIRKRFQRRFGDGGAGYVPIQPSSPDYRNHMVELTVVRSWDVCTILSRCDAQGNYGLGGVVAQASTVATTHIRTRADGWRGTSASWVELWYGAQPDGGTLELQLDGDVPRVLPTDHDGLDDRWHALDVPPGAHSVTVRATGEGPVRVYGVVLETDGPGVVWDTISLSGAFTERLLEHDADHFARHLHHRRSDLVLLRYGGNDLRRYLMGAVTLDGFRKETRELLERVRGARPQIGCLLTGITDHGRSGPLWVRPEHVESMVDAQRQAAEEAGCAYFDSYRAMGGPGSIHRWAHQGLAADDLIHFTVEGRRLFASWLYDALVAGYVQYRLSNNPAED